MALAQVGTWRAVPGRYAEFIEVCKQAQKINERLGAQVRIWQTQVGDNVGTVTYVTQHADGGAYGQFIDKINADNEWQQLVASFQRDPLAEQVQSSLLQELP